LALLIAPLLPEAAAGGDAAETFDWGFKVRVRQEYLDNAFDYDADRDDRNNWIRVRSQLHCSFTPVAGVKLFARINNEHKHWLNPERDFEIDELVFESLYLELSDIGGSPVTLIVGRQNLMYGEGFVLMDGSPLDGSRTAYMNAALARVRLENRVIDIFGISNPHYDKYLPVVNSLRRPLIEWDEAAVGVYYTDTSIEPAKIEGYFIYKQEDELGSEKPEVKVSTVGARISGSPAAVLKYAAEGAYQFGTRGNRDSRAFGGYAYGTFMPELALEPALTLGYIYLSGDEGTGAYGGWNPLFSRWPKWSELYIYSQVIESYVAYWSNLSAPYIRIAVNATKDVKLRGTVYHFGAVHNERRMFAASDPFWTGTNRGLLTEVKCTFKLSEFFSGHLLYEAMNPGDFYKDGSGTAHFLRWEFSVAY
jgi:hypothetical protein